MISSRAKILVTLSLSCSEASPTIQLFGSTPIPFKYVVKPFKSDLIVVVFGATFLAVSLIADFKVSFFTVVSAKISDSSIRNSGLFDIETASFNAAAKSCKRYVSKNCKFAVDCNLRATVASS